MVLYNKGKDNFPKEDRNLNQGIPRVKWTTRPKRIVEPKKDRATQGSANHQLIDNEAICDQTSPNGRLADHLGDSPNSPNIPSKQPPPENLPPTHHSTGDSNCKLTRQMETS